jgi:aminoacylase
VTSLNLTMLKAGVTLDGGETYAFNVVPHEAEAGFDIRVPPVVPPEEITALLDTWYVPSFFACLPVEFVDVF